MAKRHAFEELFHTKFRWPCEDDTAFVVVDNPFENATLAPDKRNRLALMTEGYKKAADLMVAASENDRCTRNFLVYPIIFNYRHFLELSLKFLLDSYGPNVAIEPNWNSHRLDILWAQFLDMLERYGTPDPDDADPVVEEIILEFSKIDPGSYSHRYPVDRQGNPLPVGPTELHLPTLCDVINGVAGYFTGCDGYLNQLTDS